MFVSAALLAIAAIAPAKAERVYVPVLGLGDTTATQVWVSRGVKAARVATASEAGLLALDAKRAADVYAWVADKSLTQAPVIGEYDTFHAGAQPGMALAASYDRLLVGAANLSNQRATCEATLFGGAHEELARIPFEVEAKSLYREDGRAWTAKHAASAEVTCNQEFYPVAATTTSNDQRVIFAKGTGPNGPCFSGGASRVLVPQKQPDGTYVINVTGVFHQASLANPKGIVCVRAPADVSGSSWRLARIVFDWDVTVGPWWSKNKTGIHNLGYFFGNRYRSGVIGNFNGLGPNKSLIKNMQNFGMPAGSNTNVKTPYELINNKLYHTTYTFDASSKSARTDLKDSNGAIIKSMSQNASPGNNQTLVLDKYASTGVSDMVMVNEFGNYASNQSGHPEVPTPGWVYANLHIKFIPK